MKWFKKLFQGKCEKLTEEKPGSSKAAWMNKFDSMNYFMPPEQDYMVADEALKVLDVYVPVTSEVYALTTIRNFRANTLNDYVYESEWVVVSHKQLLEPRFQRRLKKTDTLTDLCRSLAESSVNKKLAEVIAKPPNCHCHELSSCESEKPLRSRYFRRIVNSFKRFLRLFCHRVKHCKIFKTEDVNEVPNSTEDSLEDPFEAFNSTNTYLCR